MGWRKKKEVGGRKKRKIDDDGFAAFLLFFRFLCPLFQLWCICPLQQAIRSSASMQPEQEKEREMGNESAKESSLSCKRKVFFLSDRRAREWRLSIFFLLLPLFSLHSSLLATLTSFDFPLHSLPLPRRLALRPKMAFAQSMRASVQARPTASRRAGVRAVAPVSEESARERGKRIAAKEEIFFPFDVRRWPPENFGDALDRSTARSMPFFHFFLSSTALWLQVSFVRAHRYQNQTHSLTIHPRFPSSKKPIQKSYLSLRLS